MEREVSKIMDSKDFKKEPERVEKSREKYDRILLAQVAKLVHEHWWEIPWTIYAQMYGFEEKIKELPRFLRSQIFRDPDYPENVLTFFNKSYNEAPERAISMTIVIVRDMIKESKIKERDLEREYPIVHTYLKGELKIPLLELAKIQAIPDYLELSTFPDDFYKKLTENINLSYRYGLYTSTLILVRKFLENLLIDILRKKYGMRNLELFFDKHHGRFRMLNELIKSFETKLSELRLIEPRVSEITDKLKKLREEGNAAAHALETEIRLQREDLDNIKNDVYFLIASLIRIYNNIS